MGKRRLLVVFQLCYLSLDTSKNDTHRRPLLCTYKGSGCWGSSLSICSF